jgi:hypothetical protein
MSLIFSLRLVGHAPDQLVGLGQEPFQERRVIRVMTAHDEIDCRRFATIGRLITDQGRKFCA